MTLMNQRKSHFKNATGLMKGMVHRKRRKTNTLTIRRSVAGESSKLLFKTSSSTEAFLLPHRARQFRKGHLPMINATRLVSKHPVAAALCISFCALLGYSALAAILPRLDRRHESWMASTLFGIDFLMTFLELSVPLAMAVAAAFKTSKILGQRVAKDGYLIVLALVGTYWIAGFLTSQVFRLVSKTFGIQ